ncbi:MAG: hypothetical protein QOD72_3422, partial [Acidimicrobiaceae bacterium]|nr:hypothetical protein [Acidimicrobiaceae bacterium]
MFVRCERFIVAVMEMLPLGRPFVMQDDGVGAEAFVLPAGTVTFLLTDVEGSSRLWEERPDEMADAVVRHYAVLDEAIVAHGGVRPVEQGEGDSVVGAFARAADAGRAAVEAQRSLTAELPWLRVRMAVHTGEAQLRDEGNYVGRTIIRCARIRACAHGGQIVVSEATAALLADSPGATRLTDLGTVRLRDLSRPEHVWQVVADGLPVSFPPLRSLDAAPHNLPVPRTSFIGRERELAAVAQLVRDERVVTVTGSGGCGKTRLALHTAAELVDAHPGGTWWVDLAPVTTPDAVVDQVAGAVGTAAAPGANSAAALVGHLRGRGATLLVIDNAEHLVGAVAEVVDALVSECPDVRLLVTSREPLGVDGEFVWRVPSLSVPPRDEPTTMERLNAYESARLFLDRARRVRPNLVVDDENAALVASVCARLDGIPLAVELAAARVRSVPLDALARGLDQAFRLLSGGARTAMPRQQTLLASIAWSVDLLDDTERAVLRRLAVFQGSFPLDAAEAVTADGNTVTPYAVLDVIGRLVDKSLVLLDDTNGQYRLLETIRQFALDRMRDAGELLAVRQRYVTWFADWCESLGRGEHDFDLGPTHPALPDVFAALDWAYDNAPRDAYRISRGLAGPRTLIGRYAEFDRQYAWLSGRDGSDDPAGWAAAVAGMSQMAMVLGRGDYFELAARAKGYLDPADVASRCLLRSAPATIASLSGDPREIAQLALEAEQAGDDHAARICHQALACGYINAGELDAVEAVVEAVRRMLARRRLPFAHHTALLMVGIASGAAALRGDLTRARSVVDTPGQPDATMIIATNAYASIAAYAAGDLALVDRLAQWQAASEEALRAHIGLSNDRREWDGPALHLLPNLDGPALNVHWVRALIEQRWDDALPIL